MKKSVFNSNVQLIDSVNILNSNKLIYLNDVQKAIAVGKVNVSDDESNIFCDSICCLLFFIACAICYKTSVLKDGSSVATFMLADFAFCKK